MKLIESKAELLQQGEGLQGIYQIIELAGRTCYKSEDKITDSSSVDFVKRMITSGHTAMLEHGTVYLYLEVTPQNASKHEKAPSGLFENPQSWREIVSEILRKYRLNPYSKVHTFSDDLTDRSYITTNYRVLVENNWIDNLKYICEPTQFHEKRVSLKFTTDRGVSHELVRHRVFSFAQESTRYCNYSKEKFGSEVTFVHPAHSLAPMVAEDFGGEHFIAALENAEEEYLYLINHGWSPQQARAVLPNALKTEIVMTGFASDWKHFFDLRYFGTTGNPHPDMLQLTTKAKAVLEEAGLWQEIISANNIY